MDREIPSDGFEVIRDHGHYLVKRNTALVERVLMVKRQMREAKERAELEEFSKDVRKAA